MSLFLNRAKQAISTVGTGSPLTFTGGGIAPYRSWSGASAVNGATYPYLIIDGADWEEGYGVYNSGAGTITRNMTASSTGSLLVLSGGATCACIARAEDMNEDGANVNTDESQGVANTWGDLATVGPTVSLQTGSSAFVTMCAMAYKTGGAGNTAHLSFAVSGATTIAVGTYETTGVPGGASWSFVLTRSLKVSGLTPGLNTFTMKYFNDGGSTWHFFARSLTVKSSA